MRRLVAGILLFCGCQAADGLVVVELGADPPVSGVASLEVTMAVGTKMSGPKPITQLPSSSFSMPPTAAFAIDASVDSGSMLRVHVDAFSGAGEKLAAGDGAGTIASRQSATLTVILSGAQTVDMAASDLGSPLDFAVHPDFSQSPDMVQLPTPTVTGVSPARLPSTTGGPVTISGSNFAAGVTVTFAGLNCANVVRQSAQTLSCVAPANPGYGLPVNVVVTNTDGQFASSAALFRYSFPQHSFAATPQGGYDPGGQGADVTAADFNGDGFDDLVVANGNPGTAVVFLAKSDRSGTFTKSLQYSVGTESFRATPADLNVDGKLDFAVCDLAGKHIAVFLGDGKGNFTNVQPSPIPTSVAWLAFGNLDGDTLPDAVATGPSTPDNNVYELKGNGDGTFQTATIATTEDGPEGVALGFFNNDAYLDLAVADFNVHEFAVLLGNGNGTFMSPNLYGQSSSFTPYRIVVADVDGDGKQDLVGSDYDSANSGFGIAYGDGVGGFSMAPTLLSAGAGTAIGCVAVADFDNDGLMDVVVPTNSGVSIRYGAGNRLFGLEEKFGSNQAFWVTVGDFNGDGRPDLATVSNANLPNTGVTVLLNTSQ